MEIWANKGQIVTKAMQKLMSNKQSYTVSCKKKTRKEKKSSRSDYKNKI